jgi:hypothetical protein
MNTEPLPYDTAGMKLNWISLGGDIPIYVPRSTCRAADQTKYLKVSVNWVSIKEEKQIK